MSQIQVVKNKKMAVSVTPDQLMAMKPEDIPVIGDTKFPKIIHQVNFDTHLNKKMA